MSSKQTETNNIDVMKDNYAQKTIDTFKEAATEAGLELRYPDDFPNDATGQLDLLRRVSAIANSKPQVVITSIYRQEVRTTDEKTGKPIVKEYLTYRGDIRATTDNGIPYAAEFEIGKHNKPNVVGNMNQRYDPQTGKPTLPEKMLSGQRVVYNLELPKEPAKRKKMIDDIIGDTLPDNITFGFRELAGGKGPSHRDNSYDYNDAVTLSIDELRQLSAKGGGSKSLGWYRDTKDGKLKDRDGNPIL